MHEIRLGAYGVKDMIMQREGVWDREKGES